MPLSFRVRDFFAKLATYCLFSGCLLLTPPPAGAEDPKPAADAERINKLISSLGAEEFSIREKATLELVEIGLPAFRAVEAASENSDREIRYRAERILRKIRQSDLDRRITAFLKGEDELHGLPLPGWSKFKKTFGEDPASRGVFADFLKADTELLAALDGNPKDAAEMLAARTTQYQNQMQDPVAAQNYQAQLNFGQVGVLVFAAGQDDLVVPQNAGMMIFQFCYQNAWREALTAATAAGSRQEVTRKLLAKAVVRAEDNAAYNAMMLAKQYQMKEGLIPAERILKGNRVPHMAYYALMLVGAMGDEKHLPLVEPLLDDVNVITQMHDKDKTIYRLQVRDAALATCLFLKKKPLKDYFPKREGTPELNDPQIVLSNPKMIGFAKDEERDAVFKKWRDEKKAAEPAKAPSPTKQP